MGGERFTQRRLFGTCQWLFITGTVLGACAHSVQQYGAGTVLAGLATGLLLVIGFLIYRCGFLPRILGVLMLLAGAGWLVFLSPLAHYVSAPVEVLGILAELLLMLWLLVRGVDRCAEGATGFCYS